MIRQGPTVRDFTPYSVGNLKTRAASGRRKFYGAHAPVMNQCNACRNVSSRVIKVATKWINLEQQSGVFPGCFYLWNVTTCNLCRRRNWTIKASHMSCVVWTETRQDWLTDSNEATFNLDSKSQSPWCLRPGFSKSSSHHQSWMRLLKYGCVVWRFKIVIILSFCRKTNQRRYL